MYKLRLPCRRFLVSRAIRSFQFITDRSCVQLARVRDAAIVVPSCCRRSRRRRRRRSNQGNARPFVLYFFPVLFKCQFSFVLIATRRTERAAQPGPAHARTVPRDESARPADEAPRPGTASSAEARVRTIRAGTAASRTSRTSR